MSLASIEARAAELMSMHKEQLTRALAHFEFISGHLFHEAEAHVKSMLGIEDEAQAQQQLADEPVKTEAPKEPEAPPPAPGPDANSAAPSVETPPAVEATAPVAAAEATPSPETAEPTADQAIEPANEAKDTSQ